MNRRATGSSFIAGAVLSAMVAVPARAEQGSLLVVVEAPPELAIDAGEVRRAIGSELHGTTVAPAQPVSDTTERALIVSVDHERIAMSLRESAAIPVSRVIPAPADRSARVRAIAWLAGNLARDQVTSIMAEAPAVASPLASMPALPSPAGPTAAAAPPAADDAVEPPPYRPSGAPVLAAHQDPQADSPSRWIASLEAGPVVAPFTFNLAESVRNARYDRLSTATVWRLELRRLSTDRRFLVGVSVEGTTGSTEPETFGAAGLCGWNHQFGRWAFEQVLGVGLDLAHRDSVYEGTTTTASLSSNSGYVTSTTVTRGGLGAGVYGMAALALSHPLMDAASWFLRLGAHVSTVDTADLFVWTSLGVSYGL